MCLGKKEDKANTQVKQANLRDIPPFYYDIQDLFGSEEKLQQLQYSTIPISAPLLSNLEKNYHKSSLIINAKVMQYAGDLIPKKGENCVAKNRLIYEVIMLANSGTSSLKIELFLNIIKQMFIAPEPQRKLYVDFLVVAITYVKISDNKLSKFLKQFCQYLSNSTEFTDYEKHFQFLIMCLGLGMVTHSVFVEDESCTTWAINHIKKSYFDHQISDQIKFQKDDLPNLKIPWILAELCTTIASKTTPIHEIFRSACDSPNCTIIKMKLDKRESIKDMNVSASEFAFVFNIYVMSCSLLTPEVLKTTIASIDEKTDEMKEPEIEKIIASTKTLPPENLDVLIYIIYWVKNILLEGKPESVFQTMIKLIAPLIFAEKSAKSIDPKECKKMITTRVKAFSIFYHYIDISSGEALYNSTDTSKK